MSEKYNGWTNYETWLVNLWLTNEQETEQQLIEIIKNIKKDKNEFQKATELKDYVENMVSTDKASLQQDLINSALSVVSWLEIIENNKEE
jgi:hypothetical protein